MNVSRWVDDVKKKPDQKNPNNRWDIKVLKGDCFGIIRQKP